MADEARLKRGLMKDGRRLLPSFVFNRHEDRFTAGIPDISIVGTGVTSWWEVKHANPRVAKRALQDLNMLRIHAANGGRAYYLIYADFSGVKTTHILTPAQYASKDWYTDSAWIFEGFNHEKVIYLIQGIHRGLQPL